MPTICPNCLRPVRTGAKYCGFCGSNLAPPASDAPAVIASNQPAETKTKSVNASLSPLKPKRSKTRRVILILLIIVLIVVLIVAFIVHYWGSFFPMLGQIPSILMIT